MKKRFLLSFFLSTLFSLIKVFAIIRLPPNLSTNIALAETYKKNTPAPVYKNLLYKRMEVKKGKINLYFDNAPNGIVIKGDGSPTEVLIAEDDKSFLPAEVKLEKGQIVVGNGQIANTVAIRFSFSNTGMSNLFNKEGLPVTPFRTDNWKVLPSK